MAPRSRRHRYDVTVGRSRQGTEDQDQETTTPPIAAPAEQLERARGGDRPPGTVPITTPAGGDADTPGDKPLDVALGQAGFGPRPRPLGTAFCEVQSARSRPGHLDALDGVRAVAIAMVLLFHLGLPWAQGGYVGVDVFFVLSGFLITGILVREQQGRGDIALTTFWARRARRLLPALCLMLLVLVALSAADPTVLSPSEVQSNGLATLFYVQNWHLILLSPRQLLHQAYFPSPLLHTWSLAVEEQFYLVWPVVVLLATRRDRRGRLHPRRLWAVIVAGSVASAGAMAAMALVGSAPLSIYYDSGTRAFELLIGAGLALLAPLAVAPTRPRRARPVVAGAGLAALASLIAYCILVPGIDPAWIYEGGLVAASVASALLIWSVTIHPDGLLGRTLSLAPAVALGRISYGVYLWHWPVLVLVNAHTMGFGGGWLNAVRMAMTLAAALSSWVLLERPVHALGPVTALRRLVVPVAATAAACALIGLMASGPALH